MTVRRGSDSYPLVWDAGFRGMAKTNLGRFWLAHAKALSARAERASCIIYGKAQLEPAIRPQP